MILTTALFALAGCDAGNINTDDTSIDSADTETTGGNEESPSIESADVHCYLHSTGDQFYQWTMSAQVDDPQGRDTIEVINTVEAYLNGDLQASYSLVCPDTSGDCVGSFRETDNGILCSTASNYDFKFLIVDEDGNSASKTVQGYEGTAK